MSRNDIQQIAYALDLSQSLLEKSSHHKTILAAYEALVKAIAQPINQVDRNIKLVPIRQLFDYEGNQVCNLGSETCHFYVLPATGGLCGASCNHCQRGIPNNKPHRLCPVIHESAA